MITTTKRLHSSIARISSALVFASLFFCWGPPAANAATVSITPTFAPNFLSSPSWPGYNDNAIDNMIGPPQPVPPGRAADPEGIEEVTAMFVPIEEVLVTTFPSWRGTAAPAAPFNNEGGNRIHFGVSIRGDGSQVSLRDGAGFGNLDWELEWQDKATGMSSTSSLISNPLLNGRFDNRDYDGSFVGVTYDNGVDPSGGVTLLNSGEAGDTPVDEIHYVGVGDGLQVVPLGMTDQESIDLYVAKFLSPGNPQQQICMTYDFDMAGMTVTDQTCVMLVPEPATGVVMGWFALLAGLAMRRR